MGEEGKQKHTVQAAGDTTSDMKRSKCAYVTKCSNGELQNQTSESIAAASTNEPENQHESLSAFSQKALYGALPPRLKEIMSRLAHLGFLVLQTFIDFYKSLGSFVKVLNMSVILCRAAYATGLFRISRSILGNGIVNHVFHSPDSEYYVSSWSLDGCFNTILLLFFPPWIHGRRREKNKIIPDEGPQIDPRGNWFVFVNGMMCSREIVEMNRKLLKRKLKLVTHDKKDNNVPVNLFHNVPDSFLRDLVQCYSDKEMINVTKPTRKLLKAIVQKLQSPNIKKVVVLCHSQGTIIVARVLKLLSHLIRADKGALQAQDVANRLEIYSFATCANTMNRVKDKLGNKIPMIIEHFVNTDDIVAKLGIDSPKSWRDLCGLNFDGRVFKRENSGHLFNTHYLDDIMAYKCDGDENKREVPINGDEKKKEHPSSIMQYFQNSEAHEDHKTPKDSEEPQKNDPCNGKHFSMRTIIADVSTWAAKTFKDAVVGCIKMIFCVFVGLITKIGRAFTTSVLTIFGANEERTPNVYILAVAAFLAVVYGSLSLILTPFVYVILGSDKEYTRTREDMTKMCIALAMEQRNEKNGFEENEGDPPSEHPSQPKRRIDAPAIDDPMS